MNALNVILSVLRVVLEKVQINVKIIALSAIFMMLLQQHVALSVHRVIIKIQLYVDAKGKFNN